MLSVNFGESIKDISVFCLEGREKGGEGGEGREREFSSRDWLFKRAKHYSGTRGER